MRIISTISGTTLILIIVFIVIFLIKDHLESHFSRDLAKYLNKNEEIILYDFTDFSWNSVCLYQAYDVSLYQEKLDWVESEGHWTMLFINGSEKYYFRMSSKNFEPKDYGCFSKKTRIKLIEKKLVFLDNNE